MKTGCMKTNIETAGNERENSNLLKTQNGITLIALVITIIVLLILAGISISMLSR